MKGWCIILTLIGTSVTLAERPSGPTKKSHPKLTIPPNGGWYGPVVALPGGEALIAQNPNKVVRYNQYGGVYPTAFTCRSRLTITGLVLDGDDLYVIQVGVTISKTRVSSLNQLQAQWQLPGAGWVYPGALVGTELYLVSRENNGVAFSYKLNTNTKKIHKSGLHMASSIAVITSIPDKPLFIISQDSNQQISIYNSTWDRIHTIGTFFQPGSANGQLHNPVWLLVTPRSTLLVSDMKNHRVSEFSLSGRFLRHLLTSQDGIYHPWSISYSRSYFWVVHKTCESGGCRNSVTRFQIDL